MRTRGFHAAAIAAAALALAFAHIDATAQTALWSRTLQGTATKVNAVARSAAADAYGYVVVTGSAQNGTSPDAFAVRFNAATGQVAWTRAIDNGLPIGSSPVDEWFGAVTDAGGNAIVLARSQPMVRKLAASSGAFLWSTALIGTLRRIRRRRLGQRVRGGHRVGRWGGRHCAAQAGRGQRTAGLEPHLRRARQR